MIQLQFVNKPGLAGYHGNTHQGLDSPDRMTVFGFNRDEKGDLLLTVIKKFTFGFFPHKFSSKEQNQKNSRYFSKRFKTN